MKLHKTVFWALGVAVCAGLLMSVGGQAESGKKEAEGKPKTPAAMSKQQFLQSYGSTLVIAMEPKELTFSHKKHVIAAGLDCDYCHPDIFTKKRGTAEAKGDFTMDAFAEGKYCGTCHDGDSAFGTKDPKSCKTCHGSDMKQPKTIVFSKPVKAVIFDHHMHTEDLGLECSQCHNKLFRMKLGNSEKHPDRFVMEALYKGKYCGGCHNGDDAFASDTKCTTCHIGVKGYERLMTVVAQKGGNGKKTGHH